VTSQPRQAGDGDGVSVPTPEEIAEESALDRAAGIRPKAEITGELSPDNDTAVKVLADANNPPEVLRTMGKLTRIGQDDDERPVIRSWTQPLVLDWLDRAANWGHWEAEQDDRGRVIGRRWVHQNPPQHCATYLLHRGDTITEAPVVEQVVGMPFFAADGTLVRTPGYSSAGRCWYEPVPGVVIPEVPSVPTSSDLRHAVNWLVQELLADFPFAGPSDRAHALSLTLQPYARQFINGPTPLHLVDAPTPGSGKGLLIRVCTMTGHGKPVPARSLPPDEPEMRKALTAYFMEGAPAIWFDNVKHYIDSGALAQATAEQEWGDRKLGTNEAITARVRCQWIMAGNNVRLSKELARRAAPRIRLDPGAAPGITADAAERPHRRHGFRHPDLMAWAMEHRAESAAACITIVQSWLAAGRPGWSGRPIGTYEAWSRTMGGVLEHAGSSGFLAGFDEMVAELDGEGDDVREFIEAWARTYGERNVSAAELAQLAQQCEGDALQIAGKFGMDTTRIAGNRLKNLKDQTVGGYAVKRGTARSTWRLERHGSTR
jgi:putative DNA primase/helicase